MFSSALLGRRMKLVTSSNPRSVSANHGYKVGRDWRFVKRVRRNNRTVSTPCFGHESRPRRESRSYRYRGFVRPRFPGTSVPDS